MNNANGAEEANVAEEATELEVSTEMEELKLVDEETETDPNEVSAEDILGTQSLLMSESDEERENVAAVVDSKKTSPKMSKRILDSDNDDDDDEKQASADTEAKLNQPTSSSVDSDKEKVDTVERKPMRKKTAALIDSDSEDDTQTSGVEVTKKKVSTLIDSDTEEDAENEPKDLEKKYAKLTKKRDKSKITGSDSEDGSKTKPESKKKGKISALVDSESEESETSCNQQRGDDNDEQPEMHLTEELLNNQGNDGKKKSKPIRASAKKALDEMQAIQSEQQRMHREAHLSIPYHKPKRHTLQEFLRRRTIAQPQLPEGTFSPMPSKRLKMNAEELKAYAKLMEERAKEATEFFRSESEEDEPKDNESMLEVEPEHENPSNESETIEAIIQAEEQTLENKTDDFLGENLPLDNEDRLEMEEDVPTISGVIITEVLELPKLDIHTLCPNAVITPDAVQTPNTKNSENLKRLITEKISELPESPSLKGNANMLIDLETGDLIAKQPTGVDNLLKRLMLSSKARKSKTLETVNILSTENGKLEMSKVNISISDKADTKEQKPGAAYFKLKENLKSIITNKRRAGMQKKKEEEQEYQKCLDDDDEGEEVEDDEYEPEEKPKINDIDDEENDLNDEENIPETDDNEELEGEEQISGKDNEDPILDIDDDDENMDDNIMDSDENEEEEEDDDLAMLSDTNENCKRKNRIITAFQDDSDDDIDFLKPQFTASAPKSTTAALFEVEVRGNHSDEENELLNLCSGQFGETQQPPPTSIISQIPATQVRTGHDEVEEIKSLCSGTFLTQNEFEKPTEQTTFKSHKILSSDEDRNDDIESTDTQNRSKKLTKKMKKKKPKLGFSDDEDETEDEKDMELESDAEEVQEVEEAPETFIDYDSEENEVVVQMTKKDRVAQAQKFFEKEAELSESEWGSADEDEKHLDKYDIELGDEDEFDREKLRVELGQIHARKMLDEDIREVRKIQEMLFEDEEKDGVGRQRQFKWKNAENGFNLDESNRGVLGDAVEIADGSGDEENEHLWRKIRFEREQILQEQGLKENSQTMSSLSITATTLNATTLLSSSSSNNTTTGTAKKLNIITANKTMVTEKKSSPFLISKNPSALNTKTVRGSFLVRDKETLTKLAAGLTRGSSAGSNTADETAGTVSTKVIKPKNFVFATLTEEEHETNKRKASELMNSNSENGINYMKKPKLEPRRDKCRIDQLL